MVVQLFASVAVADVAPVFASHCKVLVIPADEYRLFAPDADIADNGRQVCALILFVGWELAGFQQSGVNVEQGDGGVAGLTFVHGTRYPEEQRYACRLFPQSLFAEVVLFTEVLAVVAVEHDDGVVHLSAFFQCFYHFAYLFVDEGDAGQIGMYQFAMSAFYLLNVVPVATRA